MLKSNYSHCVSLMVAFSIPTTACAQPSRAPFYSGGIYEYNIGNYDKAVGFFGEALKIKPDDFSSLYYMGLSYFQLKRYSDALRVLEKAAAVNPGSAECPFHIAICQLALRRYARAVQNMDKARELDPSYAAPALYYSGIANAGLGLGEEAERCFLLAMQQKDVPPELYSACRKGISNLARPGARQLSLLFSGRYEYDSNVMLLPEDRELVDISGEDDFRFMATGDVLIKPVLRPKFELGTEYFFTQSVHHRLGDYNLQGHSLVNTALYKMGVLYPFAGYEFDYFFLDDNKESFLRTNAILAGFNLFAAGTAVTQFNYRYSIDDFFSTPAIPTWDRDDHNNSLGFDQYLFFGKKSDEYFRFGFYYDRNSSTGDTFFYDGYKFAWELYKGLFAGLDFNASAEYYLREFSRDSERRRDNRQTYNFALIRNLNEYLEVGLNYNLIINASGDPRFRFKRNIFTLFCTASF